MGDFFKCNKIDCSANRIRHNKKQCIALDSPFTDRDCPFYKSDPMGKIEKAIEEDIKAYTNSKFK